MKLGECARLERLQPVLVDEVIANQATLGPVIECHVKRERLQQLVAFKRFEEVGAYNQEI